MANLKIHVRTVFWLKLFQYDYMKNLKKKDKKKKIWKKKDNGKQRINIFKI